MKRLSWTSLTPNLNRSTTVLTVAKGWDSKALNTRAKSLFSMKVGAYWGHV